MNQEELRLHRCCFTGHRPDKMELGKNEIKPLLEKAIDEAIADGYVTFITGMAMGTDIWAAEIVLERKKMNKDLHLICALPHPNFESRRSMTEKMKFNKILKNADLVKEINDHYFTGCYQVRNEWMVDRSNLVVAVFNGQKSGTKNTVDYGLMYGIGYNDRAFFTPQTYTNPYVPIDVPVEFYRDGELLYQGWKDICD